LPELKRLLNYLVRIETTHTFEILDLQGREGSAGKGITDLVSCLHEHP